MIFELDKRGKLQIPPGEISGNSKPKADKLEKIQAGRRHLRCQG